MNFYSIISVPLWFGRLNIKHRDATLFSERYGHVPTMVLGKFRITWRPYR